MKKNITKKNTGFTLVETLVSIAIFSISILGILSVLASGVTNTTYAKDKMIAGYLAQEGIEYLRNLRDNDALFPTTGNTWSTFVTTMTPCTSGNVCGFNSATIPISVFSCGSDPSGIGCNLYYSSSTGTYNDATGSGAVSSGFTRKVWMTQPAGVNGSNEETIHSEVDWLQGSSPNKIILSENLFNWE